MSFVESLSCGEVNYVGSTGGVREDSPLPARVHLSSAIRALRRLDAHNHHPSADKLGRAKSILSGMHAFAQGDS